MGLPEEAVRTAADQHMGREFFEAPLMLPTESYESFTSQLHLGQESEDLPSVEEELRRLQIDPEVFYRNAKQLGLQKFTPDDSDPSKAEAADALRAPSLAAGMAAAIASANAAFEEDTEGDKEDVVGDTEPETTTWAFRPPGRGAPPPEELMDEDEREAAEEAAKLARIPGLHVPQHASEQEEQFEEIDLENEVAETHGGRLGHETPRDFSAKLQIDSLTDDGDEVDFRADILEEACPACPVGDGEAAPVEDFSLDPDFDYDNIPEALSRRC